jgi:hypothetical protein
MCQYQEWTVFAPVMSAVAAMLALYVAWINLRRLQNGQTLQAQMNLISLENEIRKNHIQYKVAVEEYTAAADKVAAKATVNEEYYATVLRNFADKKTNAFELYITSADRLAASINADYLHTQFPGRDWKKEYSEIFKRAKEYHLDYVTIIPRKEYMMRNIDETLKKWGINQ